MNVDWVVAKMEMDKLRKIFRTTKEENQGEMCDDIIEFVKMMDEKYGKGKSN